MATAVKGILHGTAYAARRQGCTCGDCKDAQRAERRKHYANRQAFGSSIGGLDARPLREAIARRVERDGGQGPVAWQLDAWTNCGEKAAAKAISRLLLGQERITLRMADRIATALGEDLAVLYPMESEA